MTHMARNALRQPLLWVAVAVLLVNDHLLKGSGLLPGALTGKLSDFAWLVVAPAFLGALVGVRGRPAAAAVIGGIAALFTATELSATAAAQAAELAGRLGVPTRLWADPTDLIALSVLPITWHVMTQPDGVERPRPLSAPLGRLGMGLGIFASIATTNPPPRDPTWTTGAFLFNATGGSLDVRVRWTSAAVECDALSEAPLERAVSGVIFDEAITYRLEPDETVPLERVDPRAPTVPLPSTGRCQLALVAVDGAPDTIVIVPPDVVTARATQVGGLDMPGRAVVVSIGAAGLEIAPGDDLVWGLRDDRAWAPDCAAVPAALQVSWSGLPNQIVRSRRLGPDGCTELVFDAGRAFLCVPPELVPFAVGDAVTRTSRSTTDHDEDHIAGPGGELVVVTTTSLSMTVGDVRIERGMAEACDGVRLGCGAYLRPLEVAVTPVRAPSTTLVALGPSEEVVIAPAGCDEAHRRLGSTLSFAALVP